MCKKIELVKEVMGQYIVVLIMKQMKCIILYLIRVAIKHSTGIFRNLTTARRTLREISILRQCKYPHIAQIMYFLVI